MVCDTNTEQGCSPYATTFSWVFTDSHLSLLVNPVFCDSRLSNTLMLKMDNVITYIRIFELTNSHIWWLHPIYFMAEFHYQSCIANTCFFCWCSFTTIDYDVLDYPTTFFPRILHVSTKCHGQAHALMHKTLEVSGLITSIIFYPHPGQLNPCYIPPLTNQHIIK